MIKIQSVVVDDVDAVRLAIEKQEVSFSCSSRLQVEVVSIAFALFLLRFVESFA